MLQYNPTPPYLNLAKDKVGLVSESDRLEVFKELTKLYEPLALGNVNRLYNDTRSVAKELLALHMDASQGPEKIEHIIKALTETYTHNFLITRDIAEKIGLSITKPSLDEERLITRLYESYERELKMDIPLDAESLLTTAAIQAIGVMAGQQSVQVPKVVPQKFMIKLGAAESVSDSFVFVSEGLVYPALCDVFPQLMAQAGWYPPTPSIKYKSGAWKPRNGLSGKFE